MAIRGRKRQVKTPFGRYLDAENISYEQAAAELGTRRQYISMLAVGAATPSASLMYQIERWSKGRVPMQVWFGTDLARVELGIVDDTAVVTCLDCEAQLTLHEGPALHAMYDLIDFGRDHDCSVSYP